MKLFGKDTITYEEYILLCKSYVISIFEDYKNMCNQFAKESGIGDIRVENPSILTKSDPAGSPGDHIPDKIVLNFTESSKKPTVHKTVWFDIIYSGTTFDIEYNADRASLWCNGKRQDSYGELKDNDVFIKFLPQFKSTLTKFIRATIPRYYDTSYKYSNIFAYINNETPTSRIDLDLINTSIGRFQVDTDHATIYETMMSNGVREYCRKFNYSYSDGSIREEGKSSLFSGVQKQKLFKRLPSFNINSLHPDLIEFLTKKNYQIDGQELLNDNQQTVQKNIEKSEIKQKQVAPIQMPVQEDNDKFVSKHDFLLTLKNANVDPLSVPKVEVNDDVFYVYTDDNKKIINSFFRDPDITKYCDFSDINFINADIRGFPLGNTNAKIVPSRVYKQDISNADLRNTKLFKNILGGEVANEADLTNIKAEGTDLRGTRVLVSLGDDRIKGAKFDTGCIFFMGSIKVSPEMVRSMGVAVDDCPEDKIVSNNMMNKVYSDTYRADEIYTDGDEKIERVSGRAR